MNFTGKNGYEVSFVENILFSSKDISPIKEILERTNTPGEIIVNMNLNTGKPYFRENID